MQTRHADWLIPVGLCAMVIGALTFALGAIAALTEAENGQGSP